MATNLLGVLSECNRIIKNRSRHFSILFLIFLVPISFSFQNFFFFSSITQTQQQTLQTTNHPLFYILLYFIFVLVFYTCALSSITYSVYDHFYSRPVNLVSSINSIFSSFLPLLATVLLSLPSCFSLGFLAIVGFEIVDVTRLHSYPLFYVLLPLMLYLKVNWTLAPVIVVLESRWGLEPFRKSARLMRGMKGVALSQLLIFGFWLCICSHLTKGIYGITYGDWFNGLIIGTSSCLVATFLLKDIAACTVLYIYCKANHGELEGQFGKDYVSFLSPNGNICVKKENREEEKL